MLLVCLLPVHQSNVGLNQIIREISESIAPMYRKPDLWNSIVLCESPEADFESPEADFGIARLIQTREE
ncbi:11566_t:CDS:2 [Acaulospora colombiana]|uniref:11566_t:CDS:1 n=1 Tax=Acaulospora colombiana TaxID=27376 RepID=A0ACA9KBD6_9GLOM|nr:11566_t:CDS:2 [Acaulospora colombiana]